MAYLPVLGAGYIWDDDHHLTANPTLQAQGGLAQIWFDVHALPQYYPLVHTTFWIETRLWGLHPLGFHLVNVLLHGLGAVLLWRVLRRLEVPGAWVAAAIFALHPIQVESVAWITERKNVLSGVFYFAALDAFLRWYGVGPESGPRRRTALIAGYAFFLAAMLSKTVAATLPVILLLLLWWKRGRLTRHDLLPTVPLCVVGAALGLTTAWLEKHHVGAEGAEWSLTLLERVLVAGRALWFYAGKLAWPATLTFIYPRWDLRTWGIVFPLAVVGVVLALWTWRVRLGRGPVTAVLCFAAALGPALGFLDVYPMRYSFVADHFQYLAGAALLSLAVAASAPAWRRFPQASRVAAVLVLVLLGALTSARARVYRDEETLWRDTLAKNPGAWMAHNNLGQLLVRRGELQEGMTHYLETLRLKPDHVNARSNLAVALATQGRFSEAERVLRDAIALLPDLAELHYNLGTVLASTGRFDDARQEYAEAVRLVPGYGKARLNLVRVLVALGRFPEARAQLEEEVRLHPDNATARQMLRAWGP
ncbi:MAG TPA: tetratricopeptide repeat protein [Candidatus Polarisedimenticolaceae bacterium]|nr:tetratricopeptide repeat protein [Candidatus Polarisedimenticolaceae bacterium]